MNLEWQEIPENAFMLSFPQMYAFGSRMNFTLLQYYNLEIVLSLLQSIDVFRHEGNANM